MRQAHALGFAHLALHQTTQGPGTFCEQCHLVVAVDLWHRIVIETTQSICVPSRGGISECQQCRWTVAHDGIVVDQRLEAFEQRNDWLGTIALDMDSGLNQWQTERHVFMLRSPTALELFQPCFRLRRPRGQRVRQAAEEKQPRPGEQNFLWQPVKQAQKWAELIQAPGCRSRPFDHLDSECQISGQCGMAHRLGQQFAIGKPMRCALMKLRDILRVTANQARGQKFAEQRMEAIPG
ncbi:hypothetical protein D3C75_889810 [compost metagenome]